jgi:hypothetical protein
LALPAARAIRCNLLSKPQRFKTFEVLTKGFSLLSLTQTWFAVNAGFKFNLVSMACKIIFASGLTITVVLP